MVVVVLKQIPLAELKAELASQDVKHCGQYAESISVTVDGPLPFVVEHVDVVVGRSVDK